MELLKLEVVAAKPRISGPRVGRIVEIDGRGTPVVDFPGNPLGARPARWAASLSRVSMHQAWNEASAVLMMFEDNDAARPVVIDIVLGGGSESTTSTPSPASAGEGWGEGQQRQATPLLPVSASLAGNILFAQVLGIEEGRVLVEPTSTPGKTIQASTLTPLRNLKDPVLLLQAGDEHIVIGQLLPTALLQGEGDENAELVIKGDTVRIEATNLLTLHAGSCSFELDARGRAVLLGDQIVSRARGSNKMQGGSVQLN